MTPNQAARLVVVARQAGLCIARIVQPSADACRTEWGEPWKPGDYLEMDRVRDEGTMGKAPSHADPSRMVATCSWHHRGSKAGRIWATSKEARALVRAYLALVNEGRAA